MSNNINIPGKILEQSIKFEKSLDEKLQTLRNLYDGVKVLTPAKSRQMYDKLSNAIEDKVNEINGLKNDFTNAVISINNSINKTSEFYEILEKMQILLNKGKVGTLEGITIENIKTGKFPE
jgi:CRISPR/Cas system CSM-associated protein Csm2 small subunit